MTDNTHTTYLERMNNSAKHSTKSILTDYCKGNVLDVGCSDGTLLEKIYLNNPNGNHIGVDLNPVFCEKARAKGLKVYCMDINEFARTENMTFDTIIFSSVLHEISSYCTDETIRYTIEPIKQMLEVAVKLLNPNGKIIIRDGIQYDNVTEQVTVFFSDTKVVDYFQTYIETTAAGMWFNEKQKVKTTIDKTKKKVVCSRALLKQFLFTYTWGENSWPRESQEIFGILPVRDWYSLFKTLPNTRIEFFSISEEEYAKYTNNIAKPLGYSLSSLFEESTLTAIIEKL